MTVARGRAEDGRVIRTVGDGGSLRAPFRFKASGGFKIRKFPFCIFAEFVSYFGNYNIGDPYSIFGCLIEDFSKLFFEFCSKGYSFLDRKSVV